MPQSLPALRRLLLPTSTVACLGLSNCTALSDMYHGKNIGMSGAGVVLDKPFEPYDEASLSKLIQASSPAAPGAEPPAPDLANTIGGFTRALYTGGAITAQRQNELRDARNAVQGMLLATSSNRCNAFKQNLRSRSTNTTFVLGALATTLGAAGAIVTGGASQALAGAASAASGVGAEYNKDIMANVTSTVIIPGIDKQRSGILQEIINRRCLGVSSYNLTQAMQDAVRYHAACATDVGVAAAGAALSQTNDGHATSMEAASATLDAVKALADKMHGAAGGGQAGGAKTPKAAQAKSQPVPAPVGGNPAPAAPASGTTQTTTLVGDQIDYLQCPSLDETGMLPGSAVPAVTAGAATGTQVQYGMR